MLHILENNYVQIFLNKINIFSSNQSNTDIMVLLKYFFSQIMSEPLKIALLLIFSIFAFIYFAGQLICQIFGLYLPAFYLYQQYYSNKTIEPIIQYLVVYAHLEISTSITGLFNFYFHHLKLLTIFILIYLTFYRQELLTTVYNKILIYDNQLLSLAWPHLSKII